MVDSWYYASCVKYHKELANSHHLLYNYFGFYWFSLLKTVHPASEAINALNLMNALAATGCIFVLYACLLKLEATKQTAFWLSLFCGASYGFMRYATDAETYILPLLFSLISTYFFIDPKNDRKLMLAGAFAAMAVLTHQLQIWWTLAAFIYLFTLKPLRFQRVFAFVFPLLLIPIVYYLVFHAASDNSISFLQFIGGEYLKGKAGMDISMKSILLTSVNIVRTFIQVHGNIIHMSGQYVYFSIFIALVCVSMIVALFTNGIKPIAIRVNEKMRAYKTFFLLALSLHLMFAFISSGNAEFMVMLPFLLVMYLAAGYHFHQLRPVKILALLMLVWNLSTAIIPGAYFNINKVDRQVAIVEKDTDAVFLWKNKPLVENICTYQNGFNRHPHFINPESLKSGALDSLLTKKLSIYSDMPNSSTGYSRESLLSEYDALKIPVRYRLKTIDSFENIYGNNYIYLIQKRVD
jgi:hypothetical protein